MSVRFWRSAGPFGANCLCTVPSLYRPSTDGLIPMERSKDNPHTEILNNIMPINAYPSCEVEQVTYRQFSRRRGSTRLYTHRY